MVVRVFVAGGTGVVGRRLVPQLVGRGHQVTATTTSAARLGSLEQLGAEAVVMDGLDAVSVGEAVTAARPEVIVHQMTAISVAHAGQPDMKHMDRWFASTNRLRTEGTDHLLAAAEATGVSHFVAQSYASWNGIRKGGWVKTEEDPLDLQAGTAAHAGMEAIRRLEDVVLKASGAVLRYGGLYGPGATDDQVELVRKRQFPLVGGGTGYCSWVHLDDAASATVLAVEQKARGVFNIVDDEPAPASEWLGPEMAGPAAGRESGGDDDDRGTRLLQRQGQARARLGAALSVVAPGLQGRVGLTRGEEAEELRPLPFAIACRILGMVIDQWR
jgi:nucleoside-diphosphate-sugar epimerase